VCDCLTDTAFYQLAAIVDDVVNDAHFTVRYASGERCVPAWLSTLPIDAEPIDRAMAKTESFVEQDLTAGGTLPSWLPDEISHAAVDAIIVVPISYEGVVHGVLLLGSNSADAFGPRERDVFEELGQTIGHAMTASDRKAALVADRRTELDLQFADADHPLAAITGDVPVVVGLDGVVSGPDDGTIMYVTVYDGDGDEFVARCRDASLIESVSRVSDDGAPARFALRCYRNPLLDMLATHGVALQDATLEDGSITCTCVVSNQAAVRAIVDEFETTFGSVTVRARRDVDAGPQRATTVWSEIRNELTTKQYNALKAAYLAGYFSYPRESTAQEVAASLDITAVTLSQHLQYALSKVLRPFFDRPMVALEYPPSGDT
jgi:predicted DNA binding protein